MTLAWATQHITTNLHSTRTDQNQPTKHHLSSLHDPTTTNPCSPIPGLRRFRTTRLVKPLQIIPEPTDQTPPVPTAAKPRHYDHSWSWQPAFDSLACSHRPSSPLHGQYTTNRPPSPSLHYDSTRRLDRPAPYDTELNDSSLIDSSATETRRTD